MKKNEDLKWKPVTRYPVFKTRVFEVLEIGSISPEGTEKKFTSLKAPDWVIAVPVIKRKDGDFFIMVEQWRHGSETVTVEFPGGVIDAGEVPLSAAARELLEETGKKAVNIKLAGSVYPNPAIMQNKCHIFLAECGEETSSRNLDEDEFLNNLIKPAEYVIKNMGSPPFDHALMCAALMFYMKEKNQKSLLN